MSKVEQSVIDYVSSAMRDCPNSLLMNQRLDQIDKGLAKNDVQHALFFQKIDEVNINMRGIAPQISKELNEIFEKRDKKNSDALEKMRTENKKMYAGKLSELIVYTLVGMILAAFFGLVIWEVGWNHPN